jgi:hypothetical protein
MIKNLSFLLCALFLINIPTFALTNETIDLDQTQSQQEEVIYYKATRLSLKEENAQYKQQLTNLVEKYHLAPQEQKPNIRQEVKTLIWQKLDKDIRKQQLRIETLQKELTDLITNRHTQIETKLNTLLQTQPD